MVDIIPLVIGTKWVVKVTGPVEGLQPFSFSSTSGVCCCCFTLYTFKLSFVSEKCVAGDNPLPAPLTPVFASIIIFFSSIISSLINHANPNNADVGYHLVFAIILDSV